MKKQMKLILFALLVVLLVVTLAICVSAAATTEGADDAFYSAETADGTAYYPTLLEAVAAVKDGGAITVLKDATEAGGVNLERQGLTYTITGGKDTRRTITFTGGSTDNYMIYHGKTADDKKHNGNVTIENITLSSSDTWRAVIYATGDADGGSQNISTLTLRNVRYTISSLYGIWLHQADHIVVEGEDTYMENTYAATKFGTGHQVFRSNGGADNSSLTVTAGTLIGDIYFQSKSNLKFSDCSITGFIYNTTGAATVSFDNVDFTGYFRNNVANTAYSIKNSDITLKGDEFYSTYLFSLVKLPKSVTITGTDITITGESKALCGNSSPSIFHLTDVSLALSGGAVAPDATLFGTFTGVSATIADKAAFILSFAGTYSIATKADLIATIKESGAFAYISSIPQAWHTVTMNNDDLKITLSGEALVQQSSEAPIITATAGTLIAIEKGAATYTEGTHFFSTVIEGTTYYYATLDDVLSEVVNDGTITLLQSMTIDSPTLSVSKTYTIDGAGNTLTITPANYKPGSTTYTGLIHITAGKITLKNITVAATASSAQILVLFTNATGKAENLHLTLEDVVIETQNTYGLWLFDEATLTIKGKNTKIQGGTTDLIRIQSSAGASVVSIENGTFTIPSCGIKFRGSGASATISGGTFTTSGRFVYMEGGSNSTVTISGGTISYVGTGGHQLFHSYHEKNSFIFPAGGNAVINAGAAKAIFVFNKSGDYTSDNFTLNVQSGTFDGAQCWVFAKHSGNITVGGTAHFKDTNNVLDPATSIDSSRWIGAFSLNGANGTITMTITGGIIETSTKASKPCAIYAEYATINITGGTIKGSNNVIRMGNGASTINISGGTLTNIGSGNQLIRINTSSAVCTINIKTGANLVQSQNKPVVHVQAGVGIINMTGGTVTANGSASPFSIATGSSSELNISGGTVITNATPILADTGKHVSITGGLFVLKGATNTLVSKTDGTAADVAITVSDVMALITHKTKLDFGNGTTKTIDEGAPSTRFAGTAYYLYMETDSNADEDIVTAETSGGSLYLGGNGTEGGIRFVSYLSESAIALAKAALNEGKSVSYGTLIAPADYVAAVRAFTKDALSKLIAPAGKVSYVDVPAINSLRDSNGDGVYESFSAVLTNIKEENYSREFAAVAYIVIDGVTYYGSYDTVDNARSLAQIAASLLAAGTYEGNDDVTALLEIYAAAKDSDRPGFHPDYTENEIERLDPSREYTVLFIGNSYTIFNDLGGTLFPAISTSAGYNIKTVKAIKSSWYLIDSANPEDSNGVKVHAALASYDFDFIIAQEQSTCSVINPAKFYDGVRAINELAIKEGATTILYGTWGRKAGHSFLASNNLTTEQMMWKIAAAYAAIGEELGLDVGNVGMAFFDVYANNPDIELYDPDKTHPSYAGSFLAAMTLFARMTGVDPTTIPYNGDGTITAEVAAILKEAARKAVFETPVIPDSYKTSSIGVSIPKSVDVSKMENLTTAPTSPIISINGSSYTGITGTKGQVASTESSTTGLTDAQKADIADIGYGISVIGIEKMADGYPGSVGNLINGYWSSGTNSSRFTFDDNNYNIEGDVDSSSLYTCLITLNFGSVYAFDAIGFCSGDMNGFAGAAEVYVSDDGVNWTRVPTACWDKVYGSTISDCGNDPLDSSGKAAGKTCLFSMEGFSGQYIRMGIVIGRNDNPQYYNTLSTRELVVYGNQLTVNP